MHHAAIHKLLNESVLLNDVRKVELRQKIEKMGDKDLSKVKEYLENEPELILDAFTEGLSKLVETDPENQLLGDLPHLLKSAKRKVSIGRERDSRNAESPNSILNELNE
jgi:CRISPR/Cas system-associated protein Csm6